MCGITGFYTTISHPDRQQIHRTITKMTATLYHRGPDAGDVWQDPETPLAFGHRRLSIIDLSSSGAQPMTSYSDRYVICFNGEIYNFRTLRAELEKLGAPFRGHSDTEVILNALEEWGYDETIKSINGMFAFALWDRKEKRLYLTRDRMGKKPLYVGWAGGALVFGSELKSLTAHPDFIKKVDRLSLTSYMRFGYVPSPLCIYENVWSLPAGHHMVLDLNALSSGESMNAHMKPYWSHLDALQTARAGKHHNNATIVSDFEELLETCVRERMISDVPLGAFLSGGIDSSLTVAMMQRLSDRPIKTYSIGFHERGYDEAKFAKKKSPHIWERSTTNNTLTPNTRSMSSPHSPKSMTSRLQISPASRHIWSPLLPATASQSRFPATAVMKCSAAIPAT